MIRKIIYILSVFVISTLFISHINAFSWSSGSIPYGNESISTGEISKYSDRGKQITAVCLYMDSKKFDSAIDTQSGYKKDNLMYLFLYADGTTSMGWPGNGCKRGNGAGTCSDGYESGGKVHRAIRNWSKNSDGVSENAVKKYDAYSDYQKNKTCPTYMFQQENWGENYFYPFYSVSSFKSLQSQAKKDGGTNYLLFNVGESKKLSSDLQCEYGIKIETDDKYEVDGDGEINFGVTFKSNGYVTVNPEFEKFYIKLKINNFLDFIAGHAYRNSPEDLYVNYRLYSTAYLDRALSDGKCPKVINGCLSPQAIGITRTSYMHYDLYGDESVNINDYCKDDAIIQFKCKGDNCSEADICEMYDTLMSKISEILSGYSGKSTSEKKKVIEEYNVKKDELNAFCLSALSNLNYSEGGCLDKCLKNAEELAKLELENGIRTEYDNKTKCNVGTSIISMIYNVLKWGKYIAPALIIILTMLDFIKAIASQNDDDMKKAQGKFIKRLIVAALLFLLPFIINFILQTFGLYDKSCDITDLFS